jgi:hypothetical protein
VTFSDDSRAIEEQLADAQREYEELENRPRLQRQERQRLTQLRRDIDDLKRRLRALSGSP